MVPRMSSLHTRSTWANGVCSTLMHVGERVRGRVGSSTWSKTMASTTGLILSYVPWPNYFLAFLKTHRINMQPPACFYRLMFFFIFQADGRCRHSQMCRRLIRFNKLLKILGLNKTVLLNKLREQLYFPLTIRAANCSHCNPLDRM